MITWYLFKGLSRGLILTSRERKEKNNKCRGNVRINPTLLCWHDHICWMAFLHNLTKPVCAGHVRRGGVLVFRPDPPRALSQLGLYVLQTKSVLNSVCSKRLSKSHSLTLIITAWVKVRLGSPAHSVITSITTGLHHTGLLCSPFFLCDIDAQVSLSSLKPS